MQPSKHLLAALSLALLPNLAAAAIDVESKDAEIAREQHNALVAERLAGTWVLDGALTRRLDPGEKAQIPSRAVFYPNPGVEMAARLALGRLDDARVFGGGLVDLDGAIRPYLLVDGGAELRLLVFTPSRSDTFGSVESLPFHLQMERRGEDDVLYLGGEGPRSAQVALVRPQRSPAPGPDAKE